MTSATQAQTRRPRDPVLRGSVDHRSREVTKRRPFSNGTKSDADLKRKALLMTMKDQQDESLANGPKYYQGDLGHCGTKVVEAILLHMDFATNTSDSALSQIAKDAGMRRDAVMVARDKAVAHGYIEVRRRSAPTGAPKLFGVPQRIQISNICWPTPDRLPEKWKTRFYEHYARLKRERSEALRNIREVQGMTRQQRAERRQAKRKAALEARPSREHAPAKLNPEGAATVMAAVRSATSSSTLALPIGVASFAAHQRQRSDLARVEENLPDLLEAMQRMCDPHASR